MPKPNEKLAESLTVLRALQTNGRRVFRSRELSLPISLGSSQHRDGYPAVREVHRDVRSEISESS